MGVAQVVKNLRSNAQALGIILVFIAGYAAFATKSDRSSSPQSKQRAITIGLVKDGQPDVSTYFKGLKTVLKPALENECEEVTFEAFTNLDSLCEKLKAGKIDIAGELTPIQYVENYAEHGFKVFLGIEYGGPYYRSIFFAPNNAARFGETLEDMAGRDNLELIVNLMKKQKCLIALTRAPSTSGYYYPISFLLDNGIDFRDIRDKTNSIEDHEVIYGMVLKKDPNSAYVGGFLADYRFKEFSSGTGKDPNDPDRYKEYRDPEKYHEPFIIDKSDPIPNGVFVISKRALEELDENKLRRIWKTVRDIPGSKITGWRSNVERDLKLVERHWNRVRYARVSEEYPLLIAIAIAILVVLLSSAIFVFLKVRV